MTTEQIDGFAGLGLREDILRAIRDAGYEKPTEIQSRAIPEVLKRRDIVGIAQTGTGKTASFTLPMLDILASGRARARMPRSLILSPTRELATQTAENFEIYGKYLNLSMALLIGGVGMGEQEKVLEKGVDVLIATPGRMLDWFDRGKILLGGVNVVVIDEADRMLDMGFIPDVERIMQLMALRKQTLLFSATMPKEIRRLAERFLTDPLEVEVARPAQTKSLIKDMLVPLADGRRKRQALDQLLRAEAADKAIIFCNRKRDVSTLTQFLKRADYNASDIHGDLDQSQRDATLTAFKRGEVDLLVATDVAARGLDISDMPLVVNFDVPLHADDYIHRIGRTGRAGREGKAFTFSTPDDSKLVSAIERLTGRTIERHTMAHRAEPEADASGEDRSSARSGRTARSRAVRREESGVFKTKARTAPTGRGREAAQPTRRRRDTRDDERPVLGLGDHVPAFLLRPVPAKALAG
ncbi:MAG: DEAD/DEAH box helicase [Geminicoccaceae bacterium]